VTRRTDPQHRLTTGRTRNLEAIISTTDLRKQFHSRRGAVEAVRGVSIEVGRGEIFGFLGPNGAGKTTTLRMLTTLLPIDSGRATVAGIDVARRPKQVRSLIGYVSQLAVPTSSLPVARISSFKAPVRG